VAHVVLFGERQGDRYRCARTRRSLAQFGFSADERVGTAADGLATLLAVAEAPVWLVRSGAWLAGKGALPAATRTGRPLCAFGAVLARPDDTAAADDAAASDWTSLLARTGGDLGNALPQDVHSLYLEAPLARALGAALPGAASWTVALATAIRATRARAVRFSPLDVHADPWLRVVQVVTSLQQGGAERVALELAAVLPRQGVRAILVALGAPTRRAYPSPAGSVLLSWERDGDREARADRLASRLVSAGADVVHGHLLEGGDVTRLAAGGVPLVLTIHNVRAGWPSGTGDLRAGDAALVVGCAQAVENELRAHRLSAPTRTVWNGIDVAGFAPAPARAAAGRAWRAQLGFHETDLVLACVANPRPQKRLHLLPEVLEATRRALARQAEAIGSAPREARLVVAGSAGGSPTAQQAAAAFEAEVDRLGLRDHVRSLGSVDDVASLLPAADVLVSTSAYEGLSLAHVEALAAGASVVATDAGGTAEIAAVCPALTTVPVDAAPAHFAQEILAHADRPRGAAPAGTALADFDQARMAEAYARLYPRAIVAGRPRGRGVLLVTNNFSTGGAQSSARRLLLGLAAEGIPVRAAVLEEQLEYPTPGRRILSDARIPVLALPPPHTIDPARAVARLLEWSDADPPAAVLLWNAIAEHKLLLADALFDVPVYDVSPGEMYFASLARYLARPRPGLPYRTAADYGARLAGVIVKYQEEAERAAALGAPVHVIPNGVPLGDDAEGAQAANRFEPAEGAEKGPFVIGTVARLAPHKKIEDLLEALRRANGRLPPHVLRVAGGVERGAGAYFEALQARAQGLAVEWVGEVEDPRPFLRSVDLFAMISEPAGCPNASLEAMAAGLPVVATDVGGAREQIEDGVTGRLVPRGDSEGLAAALVTLAHDSQARARLGTAGRKRVVERFALSRMVADYRRVCLGGVSGRAL
jgi:glycosyltransferase involved in cell wall biosynthesis